MDVVVSINGREGVPVRAIPLTVYWQALVPSVLAEGFAGEDPRAARLPGLRAMQLDPAGAPVPIDQGRWSMVAAEIFHLEQVSAADERPEREWWAQSLGLLPAEAFVWKDELTASFALTLARTHWEGPALALNFSPQISEELAALVAEAVGCCGTPSSGSTTTRSTTSVRAVEGLKPPRVYWRRLLQENIDVIDSEVRAGVGTVIGWLVQNGAGRIRRHPADGIDWRMDQGDWRHVGRGAVSSALSAVRKSRDTSSKIAR